MRTCQHVFTASSGSTYSCWYCGCNDSELAYFSTEWDTVVHVCCVIKAYNDDPNDAEAHIFYRELSYTIDREALQEYGL